MVLKCCHKPIGAMLPAQGKIRDAAMISSTIIRRVCEQSKTVASLTIRKPEDGTARGEMLRPRKKTHERGPEARGEKFEAPLGGGSAALTSTRKSHLGRAFKVSSELKVLRKFISRGTGDLCRDTYRGRCANKWL